MRKARSHSQAYIMEIPLLWLKHEETQPQLLILGPACHTDECNINKLLQKQTNREGDKGVNKPEMGLWGGEGSEG